MKADKQATPGCGCFILTAILAALLWAGVIIMVGELTK